MKHIEPALQENRGTFSIAVCDLMNEAKEQGISTAQRVAAFCNSIQTREFLRENNLAIIGKDGPSSGLGTRLVIHYRFNRAGTAGASSSPSSPSSPSETRRLVEKLREAPGGEIEAHGGAEPFLRWVRSEEGE